ncbi:serine/threonine-protein kinase [Amnibacterium setariae]|uniref:non-specific serine/threonine protein kinase n=1 Tax=Amnibacterium setariae TaxID=2306585 RepID=A0A3A1U6Y5_9MICO|nr:serine/threonine-protein kinase [Amnibacterium setariae]RIX30059.1 serine/threonine protein kinase [Amnibacterium setariae]
MQSLPVLGGRYRLGPEIGSGGMGAVHRAWDERFEREVAIKLVKSSGVERERLRREAQYLAHLDHPNLVAVLDAGEDVLRRVDTVWFAMELVHGPDLRTVLRDHGPMDGVGVRRVLAGVLDALGALHAANVVHRDLKPANVLLTADPRARRWDVKLVDLGIAHHARTDHLTSTGQIVGTAAYLSPEQVRGVELGPPTDVYALGLLAIEALSGRIAFPGGPAESAAARLVRTPDLPAAIDPSWRAVLGAMTAIDPAARPSVGRLAELVRRLPDDALSGAGADLATAPLTLVMADPATAVLAPADAPTPARRTARVRPARRHLLVAACFVLAVVAAGGWFAALTGGAQPSAAADPPAVSAPASHAPTPKATVDAVRTTPTPGPTPSATSKAPVPPVPGPGKQAVDRRAEQRERAERWMDRVRDRLKEFQPPHRHD